MKKPKSNIPYVVGVVAPNEIYWNFSTIKLAELRFEDCLVLDCAVEARAYVQYELCATAPPEYSKGD